MVYKNDFYRSKGVPFSFFPNVWDILVFASIFLLFFALGTALQNMTSSEIITKDSVDLSVWSLPGYALCSVIRMFVALFISLLVTLILGTLAARSSLAEKIIVPAVDILQSIPILGYLTLAATVFVKVMPNQSIGFEMVAIFAIFTSQVWNMILSFYQSLRMLPGEMHEVSAVLQLTKMHKFWRIDVPFAMPDLLMSMMVSLSAGWFYVVQSEAIPLATGSDDIVLLPGIGSYMWLANQKGDTYALLMAVVAMFLVILCYDQLIFRPLSHFVSVYQANDEDHSISRSWVVNLIYRTRLFRYSMESFRVFFSKALLFFISFSSKVDSPEKFQEYAHRRFSILLKMLVFVLAVFLLYKLSETVYLIVDFKEISRMILYGAYTCIRVFAVLLISMLIWVPVGVWIGFCPRFADRILPVIQFLAAFPPNLLYPMIMEFILLYRLNVNIWCAPLMILGTQWYILFNVIAAVRAIPKDMVYAIENFGLKGFPLWKRLVFPAIAPHLVTGAMAASGGAWNASIVAEVISWGGHVEEAKGLGAYIANMHTGGEINLHVWAILVMCLYVVLINRLFWYPLYRYVEKHFTYD